MNKMSGKTDMKTLCEMNLHEFIQDNGFSILRVVDGWIYTITNKENIFSSSVFVPYDPLQMMEISQVDRNVTINLNKDPNFHSDWIVDYKNQYEKYNSKHVKFTDQKHQDNWVKNWEKYGNKIIGWHKANSIGQIID